MKLNELCNEFAFLGQRLPINHQNISDWDTSNKWLILIPDWLDIKPFRKQTSEKEMNFFSIIFIKKKHFALHLFIEMLLHWLSFDIYFITLSMDYIETLLHFSNKNVRNEKKMFWWFIITRYSLDTSTFVYCLSTFSRLVWDMLYIQNVWRYG